MADKGQSIGIRREGRRMSYEIEIRNTNYEVRNTNYEVRRIKYEL